MLPDADVQALVQGRHADPFAVLGLHEVEGRPWVRAMLPGAAAVAVLDARTGDALATLSLRHPDGLFEGELSSAPGERAAYRLGVRWTAGGEGVYADPCAFGPLIGDLDLHLLAEGTHRRAFEVLGAHPVAVDDGAQGVFGVRFAVWAPNASRVSVVGSFNQWDGRRHPMRHRGGSGVWELFLPHVAVGDRYQFELLDRDGRLLPLKADPYARQAELRPGRASIVAPLPPAQRLDASRTAANRHDAPVSIYEVHLGSWRRTSEGGWLDWDALAATLPAYAAGLGFTHVELMPVGEHPLDASWGYQSLGLFSPTARHGTPEGFARFVQACHAQGLGVILDWVPAHFPLDEHGLARFDGTALYEYADPREGLHCDWHTAIYQFGRHEVRNFLAGSALYWVERFGVDGLRVDAVASMLYRDYSRPDGEWVPNVQGGREHLEAIGLLRHVNQVLADEAPGAVTLAEESTAFPGVTEPVSAGGLGFHFKWNMGWMNDTLRYMQEDPVHRKWHHPKMSFGLVYAFDEHFVLPLSHDEVVHGKRSLLGRMPGDEWQRFANLRAYYGFMWGHPGKKLLFMGQEFGQPDEWSHERELPWALLDAPRHAGLQLLVKDLNALYRREPALHRLDADAAGFQWLEAHDDEQSVFAWLRHDGLGGSVIVVCNFTPVPRHGYRLGVPQDGRWREVLNTDSHYYGGSNVGQMGAIRVAQDVPSQGYRRSIELSLPPLATIFLVPA